MRFYILNDEQILWLKVKMDDAFRVDLVQTQ